MSLIHAKFFRLLFKIKYFKRRYFGFYKRFFQPYKWFKGVKTITIYDNNLRIHLDLDDWIQQQIYFFGYYDERGIKCLKRYLKESDIFFDIGANIGCYSLIASKTVGKHGMVYSFEPVSFIHEKLTNNIIINNLENIVVEKKAIYSECGYMDIHISGSDNTGMSSIHNIETDINNVERIESITIDKYISDNYIKRIDIIKIDIEGAELYALKGMRNALKNFKPFIIIEINRDIIEKTCINEIEIIEYLQSFKYKRMGINIDGIIIDTKHLDSRDVYMNYFFVPDTFEMNK